MPIYEYECTACKHRFERIQSFSEAAVAVCPECGGAVRKVLQPVGIVFKGSGWYKTDSRGATANGKADAAKESSAEAPAEAKASGEAKSESGAKTDSAPKPAASKPESTSKPAAAGGTTS